MKAAPRFSAWAAVPDGITALMFAVVWCFPFAFGALSVKTAMLTMLVEFFLIHATGFFTALDGNSRVPARLRIGSLAGLSLFYVLMIGAFAWAFGEWWPLLAFAWLVVGKVLWARGDEAGDDATMWKMAAWAGSVAAYLFAVAVTSIVPLPRLGMREELQPRFGFGDSMSGAWVEQPQSVVAMGVLYFGLLCAAKVLAARWQAKRTARAAAAPTAS
ncbi:hypothetical protein [Arenimonas terrae]|jgi:hypothetical protein|uniref:Uncharacterized protein n=1 Tax=Arenimonas terrae TaxID=2546226 RepID=A0A5C4RRF7_9GAMM|nr:hypothetical protein [Arenimonas terrae]TNJ33766.1 hypothetical protein E1B00_10545 [Arenimonas terrae]